MASQFKTFTAGSVLTASEVNSYLMKQAVIVCDSTADYPASPVEGMTVYDKGADALKTYTTATTGWNPPWNMPWGFTNSATGTAQTGIDSTTTDLTGLSVSYSGKTNRRLAIVAQVHLFNSTGHSSLYLDVGGTTVEVGSFILPNTTNVFTQILRTTYTTTASTHTIKVRANTASGSLSTYATAPYALKLFVEDIGPNGAPA